MRKLLLFILCGTTLPSAVLGEATNSRLTETLEHIRQEHAIPAMGIAVVENKSLIYTAGFGEANNESLFRVASISKLFTAQAIMQLVEQSKLTLDDTIGQHLSEFKGSKITIRHLLTHTGGVKDKIRPATHDKGRTQQAYLNAVAKTVRSAKAGNKFNYSDTGFNLLGAIVSKVSGKPFDLYIQEHILAPAGMEATGYYDGKAGVKASLPPTRGGKILSPKKQRPYDPAFYPSEGMVTTAQNLAKWAITTLEKNTSILSADTYTQMLVPQVKTSWGDIHMGLGWQVYEHEGKRVARHAGSVRGYKSLLLTYPDEGRAIIILTNDHDAPRFDIARAINAVLDR